MDDTSTPQPRPALDFCIRLTRAYAVLTRRLDSKLGSLHGLSFSDFMVLNNLQRALALEKLTLSVEADDPHDTFLLAMALQGHADYLVTGDRRAGLLQRGHI